MRILFIGNSHTYFNNMPKIVAVLAKAQGIECEVTMLAHGGWFLEQHAAEPDVKFNILYGNYDYVVLQEHSHPFGPEETYFKAVRKLNAWIQEAGSTPVIYLTWAKKEEECEQERMTDAHRKIADEIGAILAPVGNRWWMYQKIHPDVEMYYEDGAHASIEGSKFAAKVIWKAIFSDYSKRY